MSGYVTTRGRVVNGQIQLDSPVDFPNGTEVTVSVYTGLPTIQIPVDDEEDRNTPLSDLPIWGMWADREDMKDSVEYVREQRKKWGQRHLREG